MKVLFENGRYYLDALSSDGEGFLARCVLHKTNVRVAIDPAQESSQIGDQFPVRGISGGGSILGGIANLPRN